MKRRIGIIGITGSIGESTLRVVARHHDRLQVTCAAACSNAAKLDELASQFGIGHTVLFADTGPQALEDMAGRDDLDVLLVAAPGIVGLRPAIRALSLGKDLAVASKEILVAGGRLVREAQQHGKSGRLLPVDSEHNALFQCLHGHPIEHLHRLVLTASGGPFRQTPLEVLRNVRFEEALQHPNWSMGTKVTIDSSTMANKGLEMIEAQRLFDVRPEQIGVVVHPQSIVHSLVEFVDGCMLAQLSPPSMTFPIQHALLYPDRALPSMEPLDLDTAFQLSFEPPDFQRFRCLDLARQVLHAPESASVAYNAANEVAVEAFARNQIPFLAIPDTIEHTLQTLPHAAIGDLGHLEDLDRKSRETAGRFVGIHYKDSSASWKSSTT